MQGPLNTTQKIALLLVSLGPERSAQIMAHLDQEQIARIVREIASLGKVSNQTKRAVLREFRTLVAAEEERAQSVSFAEQVLDQTLGEEKARDVMRTITPTVAPSTPPYLSTLIPSRAAELIAGEPIHIIALLLATLPAEKVAAILECLLPAVQAPVALQLASVTSPSPELRRQLEQAICAKARRYQHAELASGQAVLTDVFRQEAAAPANEPEAAPVAAPADVEIEAAFSELLTVADLRALLEHLDARDLGLALRGVSDSLRAAALRALPFRRRMAIQAVLRSQQPVRVREIAAAQERVLAAARLLQAVPEKEPVHA